MKKGGKTFDDDENGKREGCPHVENVENHQGTDVWNRKEANRHMLRPQHLG